MNLDEQCPKSEVLYCWLSIEPDSFSKLEPYAGKLARTVLRERGGGDAVLLPGLFDSIVIARDFTKNDIHGR